MVDLHFSVSHLLFRYGNLDFFKEKFILIESLDGVNLPVV